MHFRFQTILFYLFVLFYSWSGALAFQSFSATGDLDPTFDSDGKVTTDFIGNIDNGRKVIIQADGKMVVSGFDSSAQDIILVRYNVDGSLDSSFDSDGKVTTNAGMNEQGQTMLLQADGKIIVGGLSNASGNFDFLLLRYNTDGSLDTSFDSDGIVFTGFGASSSDQCFALALQTDGKIVAAGFTGSADFALARYNTDGSLDASFDSDGMVTTDFGGNDQAQAVAIQADGKIVATGFSDSVSTLDIAVARYNTDGSLDTSFDSDGMVTTDITGLNDQGRAIAIQSDGKIVVAGIQFGADFVLTRYNTDGSLDTSFDSDGKVITEFNTGSNDQANDMVIQPDGKLVVVGISNASGSSDFAIARYNTNGSLDTSFSTDGLLTIDFNVGSNDQAYGIALRTDGFYVISGISNAAGSFDIAVARIEAGTVPVTLMRFEIE